MNERRSQKSTVFVALLCFNIVLLLLQLWLFVSTLEGLIGGHSRMAIPAAIASAVIFVVNVWMLRGLNKLEEAP